MRSVKELIGHLEGPFLTAMLSSVSVHSLTASSFTQSLLHLPPPSGPVLASVPMLHGLNSKSKDAGQSTRPKHQPTGAVTADHHLLLRPRPQKPTHVTPFGQSRLRLPAVCYCRSPEWQPGRRLQKGSSITLQCVLTCRASRLCRSDSLASHHVQISPPPLPCLK